MLRITSLCLLLLAGCSTTSTLRLCQGRLEPINPPGLASPTEGP